MGDKMKNDSQVIESRLWKVSTAEAFQLYNLLQDELEYIIKRIKKAAAGHQK